MFKKMLVFVCVLALAVGVFSMTAAAQTSQDENAFKAGYAKVDINPWWSIWKEAEKQIPSDYSADQIMPLPMDGYGDVTNRLSEPTLNNDGGDSNITDDDGIYATCVAMRIGGKTLLLISVDMLRVDNVWGKEARRLIAEATDVPVDHIMISASHTHGSIDMDSEVDDQTESYREVYTAHLYQQLKEAAQIAIGNMAKATMRKGTIDAGIQTGKAMNGVRHYVQTYTDQNGEKTTYVRGSNFNDDMDGNGRDRYSDYYTNEQGMAIWSGNTSKPVSTADDSLHLLELIPETGGDPIVLVNWRAHATTGTKQDNKRLSSDYIGSLREDLKDAGYRAAFFQGASGNLGTTDNTQGTLWYQEANPSASNYDAYLTEMTGRSVRYGKALAEAAVALLEGTANPDAVIARMTDIEPGEIRTMQFSYRFPGNKATFVENEAAQDHKDGISCSRTGTAEGTYPCVHTVQDEFGQNFTYVISSSYHADRIQKRFDECEKYKDSWKISPAELNVITIGSELAFVTAPFEISDRYSDALDLDLDNADQYNDWKALEEYFGTPFVLSCTNEYWGYIPNHLAYNYGVEGTTTEYYHKGMFALGSYESQTSYVADGSGEKLLDFYEQMLISLKNAEKRSCKSCDQNDATWLPLTADLLEGFDYTLPSGHYYLSHDLTCNSKVTIQGTGTTVCLDLQGYTYQTQGTSRSFTVSSGATFNVMNSSQSQMGKIKGSEQCEEAEGGIVYVTGGTFSLYSGTLTSGHATSYGGNIFLIDGGTFNMYGGIVENGKVDASTTTTAGGNVSAAGENAAGTRKPSNFCMYGGIIIGGKVGEDPGAYNSNVYAQGNVILSGATAGTEFLQLGIRNSTRVTIDGTYTGKVNIWLGTGMPEDKAGLIGYVLSEGNTGADLSGAQITVEGYPDLTLDLDEDGVLRFAEVKLASIGDQYYPSLQEAAAAWLQMDEQQRQPIKLEQNAERTTLTLSENIVLDLNGKQLGELTVEGAGKVLCKDNVTDNFTVEGENYGKVSANDSIQAADGYMMIKENGVASFHRVQHRLTSINLRPSVVGLYYGSQFAGDEVVKRNVKHYGIALRTKEAPTEDYITEDKDYKSHVAFDLGDWGKESAESYGVLLYGIMEQSESVDANKEYANTEVYGVTYIETENGQMHLSEARCFTLQQVVEAIDAQLWKTLKDVQKNAILAMYRQYTGVMSDWNIENIEKDAKALTN